MVTNYDKEESPYKYLGVWSPMDHLGNSKDVHTSRWVGGGCPLQDVTGKTPDIL